MYTKVFIVENPRSFVFAVIFNARSGIPLHVHVELRFPTLGRLLQT